MDIKDIKSKTVAQLKEIAKELGITGISDMKKADLVSAIAGAGAPAEDAAVDAAAEPTVEAAPGDTAGGETVTEKAPAAEVIPEVVSEPEPEPESEPEPEAKSVKPTAEPQKKSGPSVKSQPKAQRKLLDKHDIPALKKEKRTLKGRIAQAVEAKDIVRVRELRHRKKELKRILNRAS